MYVLYGCMCYSEKVDTTHVNQMDVAYVNWMYTAQCAVYI